MLYHPSPQNLLCNPLSSTQALSCAEENTTVTLGKTILHLWPTGPHTVGDTLIYFLVGLFKLALLASRPPSLHTRFCLLWHRRNKRGQRELSQNSYLSPQVCPIPPFTSPYRDNASTSIFIDTAQPPGGTMSPRTHRSSSAWLTPSPQPTNTLNLWAPLLFGTRSPFSPKAATLSVRFNES